MKKKELGLRTARWALKSVYGYEQIVWDTANLVFGGARRRRHVIDLRQSCSR